jgi:hypothetical protein
MTKHLPLFCTKRSHKHDDVIAELMKDYRCPTKQELHRRLTGALRWANLYCVEFATGAGDFEYGEGMGWATNIGRHCFEIYTDVESWQCAAHRRLLRAALALLIRTSPSIRRDIETTAFLKRPRRGSRHSLHEACRR